LSLKEELVGFNPKQRKFLLFLIAGIKKKIALTLAKVPTNTYKWWMSDNKDFHALVDKADELHDEFFDEAFQLLRHDNRVMALFLEQEMLQTIRGEVKSGEFNLVKTPLAKEVYSKAMEEGKTVKTVEGGWLQFIQGNVANVLPEKNKVEQIETQKELTEGENATKNT